MLIIRRRFPRPMGTGDARVTDSTTVAFFGFVTFILDILFFVVLGLLWVAFYLF